MRKWSLVYKYLSGGTHLVGLRAERFRAEQRKRMYGSGYQVCQRFGLVQFPSWKSDSYRNYKSVNFLMSSLQ